MLRKVWMQIAQMDRDKAFEARLSGRLCSLDLVVREQPEECPGVLEVSSFFWLFICVHLRNLRLNSFSVPLCLRG